MATGNEGSPLGNFRGRVGYVILSNWRGINTMKSHGLNKLKKKKKATGKKLQQIDVFKLVMKVINQVKAVIDIGYQLPKNSAMTTLNAATSYHMLHAVVYEEEEIYIDMTRLKLSNPIKTTQVPWNIAATAGQGQKIVVTWELNPFPHKSAQPDDRVYMAFYDKVTNKFRTVRGLVERRVGTFTYKHTGETAGHVLCCYLLLVSADGKLVSETEYLGELTVIK